MLATGGQEITNTYQYTEYSQQKTYYRLLYTLVRISLKSTKIQKEKKQSKNNEQTKQQNKENEKIKWNSIRGDIHN